MKKILCLVFVLCLVKSFVVLADDSPSPSSENQNLVNNTISNMNSKINELERRLNDLERDRRFDQDRLRQLDREVSEIRRRF